MKQTPERCLTFKTVIKKDGITVMFESYYLSENNEWICFESDSADSFFSLQK